MNYCLRIIVSFLILLFIPIFLIGNEYQNSEYQTDSVFSASYVKKQIGIFDSLVNIQSTSTNDLAENIINDLLINLNYSEELVEEAIQKKWDFLRRLSRNDEVVEFINDMINKGFAKPDLYLGLASAYQLIDDYSKSIMSCQEAIILFEKDNNSKGVVDAENRLIETYGLLNMFEECDIYFNKSIKLCNKIDYKFGLMTAYIKYGESLVFENPQLSLELLKTGVAIAKTISDEEACSYSVPLMKFYINNNILDSAKYYIREYINNCESKYKLQDSNIYTLMAHIFSLEKNVDSTIFYNEKALLARLSGGNKLLIASSYLNLSGNYLKLNNIKVANEYLDKAAEVVLNGNNMEMLLNYYQGKIKYFEYIKDFHNAYLFSQKEIELNKELDIQRQQSVISKLHAGFEIQQKYILLERELEQRKAATRLTIIILIGFVIIVFSVYIFFLYRKQAFSYLRLKGRAKHIEEKLIISTKEKKKFESAFEYSVTGILILDKNGIIQYANRKSLKLLGRDDFGQIFQFHFSDFFENDYKEQIQKSLEKVFIKKQSNLGLHIHIIHNEIFHWLDISFAPLFFEEDEDTILVSLIDVTQEVISIEKEHKQKQELQTLLNSVTESILFIQQDGTIIAANNEALNRLNVKNEKLIGNNYFDILPSGLAASRKKMFDNVVKTKNPIIEKETIGSHNNLVSIYPNINSEGMVDYISEFVQDITDQKIAEEQINELKRSILRSQMNPHFIFNSLTSIQSYILRNDAKKASKYLNSLARLIRLILECSRYDYISLKNEIDILNYYLEIQKMRFSDNFIYTFDIDPDLDLEQIKIPTMLAQPFIENSIEHGIQHLDKIGEIYIKLWKNENRFLFELSDNGIGRDAAYNLNKENVFASKSLATKIINDRINALNTNEKEAILYNIVDLKNELNQAIGTKVIISIPIETF